MFSLASRRYTKIDAPARAIISNLASKPISYWTFLSLFSLGSSFILWTIASPSIISRLTTSSSGDDASRPLVLSLWMMVEAQNLAVAVSPLPPVTPPFPPPPLPPPSPPPPSPPPPSPPPSPPPPSPPPSGVHVSASVGRRESLVAAVPPMVGLVS